MTFGLHTAFNKKPLIIAHRGATSVAKENTYEAFEQAINMGVDGIEMDIRQTSDGKLVAYHNWRVKVGLRRKYLHSLTWKNLKDVIPDNIPLLKDVFEKFKNQTLFNLDIKEKVSTPDLIKLIKERRMGNQVLIDSSNFSTLEKIRSQNPNLRLFYSFNFDHRDKWDLNTRRIIRPLAIASSRIIKRLLSRYFLRKVKNAKVWGVSLPYTIMSFNLVKYLHGRNLKIFVWPIDNPRHVKTLLNFGIDGIKTGNPEMVRELLT